MDALEDLFVKILRASNILIFFGIVFAGFFYAKGMPGGEAFLIIMGSAIGGGIYCGWVALVMRMHDELQKNNDNMKTLISAVRDRKSTCLNSSHVRISYAVFCL